MKKKKMKNKQTKFEYKLLDISDLTLDYYNYSIIYIIDYFIKMDCQKINDISIDNISNSDLEKKYHFFEYSFILEYFNFLNSQLNPTHNKDEIEI